MNIQVFKNKLCKKEYKKVLRNVTLGFKNRNIAKDGEAEVFSFGTDRVIRVAQAERDACSHDSGYHAWISKIVINSKSSVVPKVYFHAIIDNKVVTVMEKLQHNSNVGSVLANDFCEYRHKFYYQGGQFCDVPKKYYQRLNRIMDKARNVLYCGDVHSNNIMFRENGEPVLTDPSY